MKKVILLMLMILPVVIALLAFAIGSFVGRAVKIEFIQNIYVSENSRTAFEKAGFEPHEGEYGNGKYRILAERGQSYEFAKFFTIEPARAKFSELVFAYSNNADNYDAAEIKNGKLYVNKNRRTSDNIIPNGEIKIDAMSGPSVIFSLYVEIKKSTDNFDYFGFDYNRFNTARTGAEWENYTGINAGGTGITISRGTMHSVLPIKAMLISGLDTAPYDLTYYGFSGRTQFIGSFDIDVSGEIAAGSIGDEFNITITATWAGATRTAHVKLVVIS